MACCAAAAFFISQIVLAVGVVRRRLFGAPAPVEARNDAVAWTLGSPPSIPARRSRVAPRTRRLIVAAFVAEAVLVAGSAAAWTVYRSPAPTTAEPSIWALALESLCTGGSIDAARERLTRSIEGNRGRIE